MAANPQTQADDFQTSDKYLALKDQVHRHLIRALEQLGAAAGDWPREKLVGFVQQRVAEYVLTHRLPVNRRETERLVADVVDELIGFGPIQQLVDDDDVDDILVNGPDQVFIERRGRLERVPLRFSGNQHLLRVIQRIIAPLGRRLDESTPMVDARLPDGSRVNAIIPPIALDGPCLSIRKFRKQALTERELVGFGTLSREMAEYLARAVAAETNLMVTGGTGSGKTTLLNMLSQHVRAGERIVTIEDAAELRLRHDHVVRLETRPANLEGDGEVRARDLVRNALRMRPDRIIVGEVRGEEILDMLQAMNTGHDGSMTTLHANSIKDAFSRLELLAYFAGFKGSSETFRQQIASAVDLMIHVDRLADGRRRVIEVAEVTGLVEGQLQTRALYRYDQRHDRHQAGPDAAQWLQERGR
jgi:pilus assembly protein CpaF